MLFQAAIAGEVEEMTVDPDLVEAVAETSHLPAEGVGAVTGNQGGQEGFLQPIFLPTLSRVSH